jgi:polar amino acid transport system substrate-binding protein
MRLAWMPAAAFLPALVLGCAGAHPAAPSAAAPPTGELAPTGTLRVAVFTGNPVIGRRDPATGELSGTTAALTRALAAEARVPLALVEYTAIAKVVEDAKGGTWDLAVLALDPARRSVVDFAPPHIAVDLTYLVPAGSTLRSTAEADQPGVRIAVARGAATALLLERSLRRASLAPAENEPAALGLLERGEAQAYAQNRYMLLGLSQKLPGSRVLDDRFSVAELALALPKGRPAALEWVSAFIEREKRSGAVARAIQEAGLRGVDVAAAAR